MLLSQYLFSREAEWGILVVIEQRVQVNFTRFRVPDISVLTEPPADPIVRKPPFLCIELLSPGDRPAEMQVRIDDYLQFGMKYVWVIDPHAPRTRRAWVHTSAGVTEIADGVLRTESPEIRVPLGLIP